MAGEISFFYHLADTLGGREILYSLAGSLLAWGLTYRFRPEDRGTLYHTLGVLVLGVIGLVVAATTAWLGSAGLAGGLREAAVLVFGIGVIRLFGLLAFRLVLPRLRIAPPQILEDILVIVAYAAWGMVRLRHAGMDLSGIVTTSALITAVVAFAMQDTLGNILGGLALELDNSVEIGDWVKVDDVSGRVMDIRWRSTSVQTRNGETVVIPNSLLMKSKFSVLGRQVGSTLQWRRAVGFNVDLATAPARVVGIVEQALHGARIPHVAEDPAPNCVLMDFEAGYGHYVLRYWLTDPALDDPTDSAVRIHALTALQRAGIRLAVAEYRVHSVKEGEKHREEVRQRELARRLEALERVDLFSGLTAAELQTLAGQLSFAPFAQGDIITRQGAVAHWLYLLVSGTAEVWFEEPGGQKRLVNTLQEGSVFGEMGLMTGAPRSATVIAGTDAACYRLDKAGLQEILESRPAIAENIAAILASRSTALETARHAAEAASGIGRQRSDLLERIRGFFHLGSVDAT